jgi:glucokinase
MQKYAIGIDLGGQSIKGALVNVKGEIIEDIVVPTEGEKGPDHVIEQIRKLTCELASKAASKKGTVIGACVATPGLVDMKKWIVRIAPNLPGWVDIPLLKKAQKGFAFPFILENDANAAAYGEKWIGTGKKVNSMIVLTIGTGIGGGLILDGKVWHGADGVGGEPGHINLMPDGLVCGCGNPGCLEAHASALGIIKRTQMAIESGKRSIIKKMVNNDLSKISPKIVYQAAKKGDKLAKDILEETGRFIGIGIMTLVNLLNPEMVALGGGVMDAGNYILKPAQDEFKKRGFKFLIERTQIVKAKLGNEAGRIGAAGIVFAQFNK